MAEFIQPTVPDFALSKPRIFSNEFISGVVKKSLDSGEMPLDHKLAFIGAVDEDGIRAVFSVQILDKEIRKNTKLNVKIQSVFEHEWTGDNKAGAQVLFSVR